MNHQTELPNFVQFGREACGDLFAAERREWWLSNGRGAYAAGTIASTLTRRYHGLLIAPIDPPLGRHLVVAKADATVSDGSREWPLFANRWASGAVHPHGHLHIESFRLDGRMPVWRYALGDAGLEQRIWMEPGAHTTYIAWRLDAAAERSFTLRAKLLVNARDHHGNTWPGDFHPLILPGHRAPMLTVRHVHGTSPAFDLFIKAQGGDIEPESMWYENFDLPVERERGLPATDHHLCVGEARLMLRPGEWAGLVASLDENASPYLNEAMRRFRARDAGLLIGARSRVPALHAAPPWIEQLLLAADSFVFTRPPDGESVIAGYPWFGEWGRDTMIALPGLTLATGRFDRARRILESFARYVHQGMLPNVLSDREVRADYNSVDAALWYIEAWRAYLDAVPDVGALRRVFPVLCDVIEWHRRGTRHGIALDPEDGLLRAGESGVQLTWMDAKVGDRVITPRIGKPVEVNALWFNALSVMAGFARLLGQSSEPFATLAGNAREGFQRFIAPVAGGLFDVLDGPAGDDATLRPNQIFAVSLPHSPLDRHTSAQVVGLCGRELLTSCGLRSLAPDHPDYRYRYEGGPAERDSAYHQGPVWAWLLGHYAVAHFRVHDDAGSAQGLLEPIRDHLLDAGLGTVSEIFDGEAPHRPRGAPSQAWSVACVLEAWWRIESARSAQQRSTVPAATATEYS